MYHLICMSFDGQFVVEGQFKTIGEAWKRSNDMGSRWIFYPFHFVLSESKKTVIDSGDILSWAKGKRIKTIQRIFENNSKRPELQNAGIEEFIFALK